MKLKESLVQFASKQYLAYEYEHYSFTIVSFFMHMNIVCVLHQTLKHKQVCSLCKGMLNCTSLHKDKNKNSLPATTTKKTVKFSNSNAI